MDGDFLRSIVGLAGVPFILAFTQLMKPWIKDVRYYPFVAIVAGLVINILVPWALGPMSRADWLVSVFTGMLAGLAAGGLYDASKTIMTK